MCITLASSAMAQSDAPVRQQFDIALSELLDDGGKVLLPGDFSGSIDPTGYVMVHDPGKATRFVQADGLDGRQSQAASSRLGCTGSLNVRVSAMAAVAGELFVGGFFSDCDFEVTANIARFDPATGEFSPLGDGVSSVVRTLAVIGTDLYVGGEFIEAGGVIARNIAVYDTTQSGNAGWSPLGSGVNGTVRALVVIGSDLYVGGSFTAASGVIDPPVPANSIIKYDTTQTDDAGWSALGSGTNTSVFALAVIGSEHYVGGNFEQAGAVAATSIAVYDTTQTGNAGWSTVGSGSSFEVFENIEALTTIGTDLYVGGSFGEQGGVGLNIAVFDTNQSDDSGWSLLGNGPDPFTIGGTVSDLSGSGLVLQNNGGDDLPLGAEVRSPLQPHWMTAVPIASPLLASRSA